jgi:hypothetical protein
MSRPFPDQPERIDEPTPQPDFNPYQPSMDVDAVPPAQRTIGSILLIVSLLAVGVGVFRIAPGLGILLSILVLPAFVRTALVVQAKQSRGALSAAEKMLLFLGSFGTTIVVVVVVTISAVGTFCFVCLSAGTEAAIPAAGVMALMAAAVVMVPIGLWIRARWRRDTRFRD